MTTATAARVLVVDDERILADTLAAILGRHGYDCRIAYTGDAAVELCPAFRPNVLLSDIFMPGLDGIEAAIRIREILPACRVLLISGQAETSDLLQHARQRGYFFELLAKPIHPADLLAHLQLAPE